MSAAKTATLRLRRCSSRALMGSGTPEDVLGKIIFDLVRHFKSGYPRHRAVDAEIGDFGQDGTEPIADGSYASAPLRCATALHERFQRAATVRAKTVPGTRNPRRGPELLDASAGMGRTEDSMLMCAVFSG
jgi:hypothetical protein